ncbi:MAG: DUF484 family protein [Gammaproteobacteria bacterium]
MNSSDSDPEQGAGARPPGASESTVAQGEASDGARPTALDEMAVDEVMPAKIPDEVGQGAAIGALDNESVVRFLRAHPDFLVRHPDLIEHLEISHNCGGAVSLLERQADRLRETNAQLRQRLDDLVRNARANEELGQRVHRLTLALMDCSGLDELLARLYESLKEDFAAELFALRLFAAPRQQCDLGLSEFDCARQGVRSADLFDMVADNKPLCGRLRAEQAELLFGERAGEVGSGALAIVGGSRRIGVLALASRDSQAFHPGMGSVFLRQLASLLTHVLSPHLETEAAPSRTAGASA